MIWFLKTVVTLDTGDLELKCAFKIVLLILPVLHMGKMRPHILTGNILSFLCCFASRKCVSWSNSIIQELVKNAGPWAAPWFHLHQNLHLTHSLNDHQWC